MVWQTYEHRFKWSNHSVHCVAFGYCEMFTSMQNERMTNVGDKHANSVHCFSGLNNIGVEKKLGCCRKSDFWHTLKCEVNEWSVDANRPLSFETENYSRIGKERRALLWSTASFVIHYIRSHSISSLYPNPHLLSLKRGSPCPTGSTSVHVFTSKLCREWEPQWLSKKFILNTSSDSKVCQIRSGHSIAIALNVHNSYENTARKNAKMHENVAK